MAPAHKGGQKPYGIRSTSVLGCPHHLPQLKHENISDWKGATRTVKSSFTHECLSVYK